MSHRLWVLVGTCLFAVAVVRCDETSSPPPLDGGFDSGANLEDASTTPDAAVVTDGGVECSADAGCDADAGESCLSVLSADSGLLVNACRAGACDLLAQSCDGGMRCSYAINNGVASRQCIAAGQAAEGAPCTELAPETTCGSGLVCINVDVADGGVEPRCAAYCGSDVDCSGGKRCHLAIEFEGTDERPRVCADPPATCDLFAQACPGQTGCYPGPDHPMCVDRGFQDAGSSCNFANDCMPGTLCVEGTCRTLCRPSGAATCDAGACAEVDVPDASDVGACL